MTDLEAPNSTQKNYFSSLFSKILLSDINIGTNDLQTQPKSTETLSLLDRFKGTFQAGSASTKFSTEPGFFVSAQIQAQAASGFAQNWPYILGLSGAGTLFMILALFSLPLLLFSPYKFCILFAIASICYLSAIAFLRDPATFAYSLIKREKLPYTAAYLLSLVGTFFFALVAKSWFFSVAFAIFQVASLMWLIGSSIPGGLTCVKHCQIFCLKGIKTCCQSCFSSLR